MGDGSLTPSQTSIYLNIKTDKPYARFLRKQLLALFGVNVAVRENCKESVVVVCISSSRLVGFLHRKGLPIGDKLRNGLDIPSWIYTRKSWLRACLRGMLDTDGCTYIDHHLYKDKKYGHLGIAYTTYSPALKKNITKALKILGYAPTLTTKHRVLLRREKEILRFFGEIVPSNKRHYAILNRFLEEYRSGYNGTASKAVVAAR